MQGSKEGVCSLKSSDQEGLIEKVIFEKREERGSGGKCRDQEVKSCLPFLKYNKATNMSEVRSEVSRGRCIKEKTGLELVGPCNDFVFYPE